MKNIDSDLIRGNIDTIILKTMIDGDKYGLDIIKEVETRSNGTYELKQPTLYSCLKRLENQELISSYWLDSDIGGKRHYYKLTEKGHETLQTKQEEWAKSKFIIDNLLSNFNYDEYRLVKKDDYDKIIEGKEFVYDSKTASNHESSIKSPAEDEIDEHVNLSEENPSDDDNDDFDYVNQNIDNDDFSEDENPLEYQTFNKQPVTSNSYNKADPVAIGRKYFVDFDDDEPENDIPEIVENEDTLDENYELDIQDEQQDIDTNLQQEDSANELDENIDFEENANFEGETFEDDSPTYISNTTIENEETEIPVIEKTPDQTTFENNILARLRSQNDEEINTYIGDQKSYVNHINKTDEEFNDVDVIQDNLLDFTSLNLASKVDDGIDEFSKAIDELNNFDSSFQDEQEVETEEPDIIEIAEPDMSEIEENPIEEIADSVAEEENLLNEPTNIEYDDEFTKELETLNRNKNVGFFNSDDNPEYDKINTKIQKTMPVEEDVSYNKNNQDYEQNLYEFNTQNYDLEPQKEVFDYVLNQSEEDDSAYNFDSNGTSNNLDDLNQIIANSANSYAKDYVKDENTSLFSFTPRYTSENYKQKLSNLSAYSQVSDEEPAEKLINEESLSKAKDIETLKTELEQEGIKVREFKKYNSHEQSEKTYLLINKMKFISSLILLFGFVFVLSAVYIILNNTDMKNSFGFDIKYFLYAFIPFGIYMLYHLIKYMINPYKKVPAKLAPRILIFLAIIITVQLLLITYCVNLQLGFYSFTQEQYNHLLWIIPTVVSFAPIIANIIYISLFYSKNFNV